jgi:thienamycin biosynthesis protein ThnN
MSDPSRLRPLDDGYLSQIVALHFSEHGGAPYWVKQIAGDSALGRIRSFDGFKSALAFKSRQEQAAYERHLRELPIEDFIPRATLQSAKWIWASETGGTTGIAKRGTWADAYWDAILAFSDEFLDLHGVPRDKNWLFIGPTGPHTTGRLVISIAEHRKGRIFCIDMDPRIVRVYLQNGDRDAVDHYIRHIWEQVEPIITHQNIGVMFCTARLLELLPQYLDPARCRGIEAIVHAGLAMSRDTHKYLREELFPNRPLVGIYGTSVSGISYQKPPEREDGYRIIYIPCQPYLVLEVIDEAGSLVPFGEQGDVRCFRFTEDQIIPGFIERDRATRVQPFGAYKDRYPWDWVGDPHSPETFSGQQMEGVY